MKLSTAKLLTTKQLRPHWQLQARRRKGSKKPLSKHIYDRTALVIGKSVAQASDLQVRPDSKTNDTVRYGGKHLMYDIQHGHLDVLMTAHETRRLAMDTDSSSG